ncbi:MAG TPA: zf-HC2 domain-containing protein [Thermoanaerobaculia bacterium]|nr:zf-HC2 domain-containing protein [Thermoanaerobaculia bacterium]
MTTRPILTCRQLIDLIGDHVAGELDDFARWDFERHLAGCSSCRAYLETYEETMTLARAAMVRSDS